MGWRMITWSVLLLLLVGMATAKAKGSLNINHKDGLLRLAKQTRMQHQIIEELTRFDGHSGLGVIRLRGEGTLPFHGPSHSDDYTMSATHDHSDFINTIGNGEFVIYLNGEMAKTRHNDYLLVRRGDVGKAFEKTVDLEYPGLPPSVEKLKKLKRQIPELRKYFEAFNKQDDSVYDYKPYFKANLCYLVGAWFESDLDTIEEAFDSERHFYNAHSWEDLYDKNAYEGFSGTKENLENYAFMPTRIWDIQDNGDIIFAQFNYKILCHELKDNLPLNRMRGVDDLRARMASGKTYEEYLGERNARFQINPHDSDQFFDGPSKWGFMDTLMEQIPGPDGYGAHLTDNAFGNEIRRFNATAADSTLNAAYFHRWFQNKELGAMGSKVRHRGMSDENMWVAMTTQPNILPARLEICDQSKPPVCQSWEQKWVYAMPLEIVYTTPLNAWNPYNFKYHGDSKSDEGKTVFDGPLGTNTRDGSPHKDKALNGINSATYYLTPHTFFEGGEFGPDPADTPKETIHVLDQGGVVREVRSSGIRVIMPSIPGIGRIRTRYPIPPIHGEGKSVWKELAALKEIVLNPKKYEFILREGDVNSTGPQTIQLKLGPSDHHHGHHTHYLNLSPAHQHILLQGSTVTVTTSTTLAHNHNLQIERNSLNGVVTYKYITCNGLPLCDDGHAQELLNP